MKMNFLDKKADGGKAEQSYNRDLDSSGGNGAFHRKSLRRLNQEFLANAELADPNKVDFTKPKCTELWTVNLRGKQTTRMIIYLRSDVGCSYGQIAGGCLACRHWRIGTAGYKLDINNMYVQQTQNAISGVEVPPVVNLYNEGNVLNDEELPNEQLFEILGDLSSRGVKRLVIESRPEYISSELLKDVHKRAGSMEIEVGIGLESVTDEVRNGIFLKSMSLRNYEAAVQKLNDAGMRSLSYVIIKPPFLTEKEAIEDSITSARYAFSVGSTVVSLEPIGVEPSSVTECLYHNGAFVPAKLWSMLHVLQKIGHLGETRLGGTQFSPRPTTLPHNCGVCTNDVVRGLETYNATYDAKPLLAMSCACKEVFNREVLSVEENLSGKKIRRRINRFITGHFSASSRPDGKNDSWQNTKLLQGELAL